MCRVSLCLIDRSQQPGFHEKDLKNRLLEFAKIWAANQRRTQGFPLPSIDLHAGSYFPNHPMLFHDKSWAKIINCSEQDLARSRRTWGLMLAGNMEIMQAKTQRGQLVRNQSGNKDLVSTAMWLRRKRYAVAFCNSIEIGSAFSLWVPAFKSEQSNLGITRTNSTPASHRIAPNFGTDKPAVRVVFHTYSVGLESILEGCC